MTGFDRGAPGLLVPHAAASSQHGFTVKASIPPIKEATQAEEHGDGGSPATAGPPASLWRFSHSTAAAGRGAPIPSDDVPMGRGGGTGGGSMPSLAQLNIVRPAQQEDQQHLAGSPTVEVVGLHSSKGTLRLVKAVMRGLRACQEPEASSEGLGGTYFFMNEAGRRAGIVKPCDEEPLAPNNPKGFVGRALGEPGLKPSVRVGEAAIREVAAFILDHDHFSSVPHTVLVKVAHSVFHQGLATSSTPSSASTGGGTMTDSDPMSSSFGSNLSVSLQQAPAHPAPCSLPPVAKLASLQEYVHHDCDTSEMGASRFAARDVHRIGILDIRIWNTDRHAGNILVRRPRASAAGGLSGLNRLAGAHMELVPIDHGFCLPEALDPPYLEWLHWPAAMIPFQEEELVYIAALDAAADKALLRRELPSLREESLRTLEVATRLLQRCAAAGLTLAEIGGVVSRPLVGLDEEPSELERLCLTARAAVEARSAAAADLLSDSESDDDDEEAERWSPEGDAAVAYSGARCRAATMDHPMEGTPSSRLSSGTLYNAGSFDMSFHAAAAAAVAAAAKGVPLITRLSNAASLSMEDVESAGSGGGGGSGLREELLFDLDDAHAAHVRHAAHPYNEPVTPTGASRRLSSDLSPLSGGCKPSPSGCSACDAASLSFSPLPGHFGREPFGAAAAIHSSAEGSPAAEGVIAVPGQLVAAATLPPVACSVAAGGAARAWQRCKTARRHGRREGPRRVHLPTLARQAGGHATPCKTPEGGSLFGGLDEAEWAEFMATLEEGLRAALSDGRWKQAPIHSQHGQRGMSCPRF